MSQFVSYKNHFLIAAPNMKDPTFAGAVIYLCEHTEKGAMGVMINRSLNLTIASLLQRLNITVTNEDTEAAWLFDGGPVQTERGFVLHRPKHFYHSTLMITNNVMLSTSKDVLDAIGCGENHPKDYLVSLGYSGWSAGQLESELAVTGWLVAPADEAIIFDTPVEERYRKALAILGLESTSLENWISEEGHA